jgi:selenocysteine lyase/cysteine desulfurase
VHVAAPAPPLAREAFALDAGLVYLNHAAVGVVPVATRDALHAFVDAHAARGVLGVYRNEAQLPDYRAAVGALIGAGGDEIALLRNTGDGATLLAQGLEIEPGDEIVVGRNEFGSNAYPWLALQAKGAVIRWVDAPRERMTPDVLAQIVSPRTKAVAVSWVTFDDGYRHDLAGLAEVAHRAGALFFVDAIQGLGAFPLDVRALGIDGLYAGGAKWLMALQGIGFVYLAREHFERVALRMPSWRSVADIWDFLAYDQPWADDATRYEAGTPNIIGALALATSIGVLRAAGIERIAAHILALTDQLAAGLTERGCTLRSVRTPNERSGIVTFTKPGTDPLDLGRRLAAAGICTTNRASGIRIAPHGYNTHADIESVLEIVSG